MNSDYKHTKDLVLISIFGVLLFVMQLVLSFIPNVNVVTMLICLYVYILGGRKTFIILIVFITISGFYYGFGHWHLGYLWIYSILIILTVIFKILFKYNVIGLSILGFIFGLLFGFLFAINDSILINVDLWVYYLKGVPFDLIHGFSNMLAILLLFPVLYRMSNQYFDNSNT